MKISKSQMFKNHSKWCAAALFIMFLSGTFAVRAQGDALFKAKCATCHQVFKDGVGPKLFEVRKKWADGGAAEGSLQLWVRNWEEAAAKDEYAKSVVAWSPASMTPFSDLTDEQIVQIFDWVDSQQEEKPVVDAVAADGAVTDQPQDSSMTWIWIIMGFVFATVIIVVGSIRRQLGQAVSESESGKYTKRAAGLEGLKQLAWENRKMVAVGSLIAVIAVVVCLFLALYTIGVVENYQPSQPIAFPHSIHAGTNGIDCKYCHNSATKSKTAGLPSVNVCMNCHKQVNGTTPAQQEKIKMIYAAAGWDPQGAGKYTGKTKEIVWNKVHVLPDHVYFNHRQHVVVGGVDCKQCHGDMTTMVETAKVQPVTELNKIEGNVKLTRPTLTMGWCIECHMEKEVSTGALDTKKNGYYDEMHRRLVKGDSKLYSKYLEDGKVSVEELGGWECAKCHY